MDIVPCAKNPQVYWNYKNWPIFPGREYQLNRSISPDVRQEHSVFVWTCRLLIGPCINFDIAFGLSWKVFRLSPVFSSVFLSSIEIELRLTLALVSAAWTSWKKSLMHLVSSLFWTALTGLVSLSSRSEVGWHCVAGRRSVATIPMSLSSHQPGKRWLILQPNIFFCVYWVVLSPSNRNQVCDDTFEKQCSITFKSQVKRKYLEQNCPCWILTAVRNMPKLKLNQQLYYC